MRRPEPRDVAVWTASIGGLVAYDVWCDRHRPQGTLTCLLKWLTRAETPAGQVLVETTYAAVGRWLVPHLCRLTAELTETTR